jgi:hypothetical protein
MYRKLPESSGPVLGYYVTGTITQDEVKEIHRDIERTIDDHGSARLLMDIGDMSTPEPTAVWEDLKLTPEYLGDVERYAILGDSRWQEMAARATALVARGEARFFHREQADAAWEWLRERD